MSLERILVPTDFSDAAERALEQSRILARRTGASLHLLHRVVYPVPTIPGAFLEEEPSRLFIERMLEHPKREAETRLRELATQVAADGTTVTMSIEDTLEPFDAILEKVNEWEPELVCLGTHGLEGVDKLLMGSVAEKVLRHIPRPVLVLRAASTLVGAGDDPVRILVPVDFSDYSQRALGVARELREKLGGTVHLLHVVELRHSPFKPGGFTSPLEVEPGLREKGEKALKGMLGDCPGDVTVTDGTIASEILVVREKLRANLVVMGCRGVTGAKRFLVGSVTEKVARFCEVPVWVVK